MNSNFLQWSLKDILHGLLIAVLTSVLAVVQTSLESGVLSIDFNQMLKAAMLGAGAYLLKKLASNNAGEFLKRNKPFDYDIQPPNQTIKPRF